MYDITKKIVRPFWIEKKKVILYLLILSFANIELAVSQTFDTQGAIAPPEINTKFLENIHNSVNFQTGALNYSVRLFSLKVDDDLVIPIDINYYSNGVKDYQSSGEVGIGWNLSANYRVTRTIYNRPDEYFSKPANSQEIFDSLQGNTKYPLDRYLTKFTFGLPTNGGMRLVPGQTEMDGEYDIFDYSTPTQSGTFVIEDVAAKKIRLAENLMTKFDFVTDTGGIRCFTIKEPNGNKVFAGYDPLKAEYLSESISTYMGKKSSYSWPVVQITTPNNRNVQFKYIYDYVLPSTRLASERAKSISETKEVGISYPASTFINDVDDDTPGIGLTYLVDSIISQYGKIKVYRSTPYKFIDSISLFDYTGTLLKKAIFYQSYSHNYYFLDSLRIVSKGVDSSEIYRFEYYSRNAEQIVTDIWDNLTTPNTSVESESAKTYPQELGDEIYWYKVEPSDPSPTSGLVGNVLSPMSNRLPRETPDYFSLEKVTLPTGGVNSYVYESNYFYSYDDDTVKKGPGIRILSTAEYDPVANKTITHYFKYGIDGNGYGSVPVEITPSYFELYQVILYIDVGYPYPYFLPGRYFTFSNSVIADNDPFFVRYNVVSYPMIIDSTENGIIRYQYKSNDQAIWTTSRVHGPGFFYTYNFSEKPYLKKLEIFDKNAHLKRKEEYDYSLISGDPLLGIKVKPYAFFPGWFTPSAAVYSYESDYTTMVPIEVNSAYDYTIYTIEFGLQVLSSKTTTEFSGSDSIKNTTNYTYNNSGQLVKEVSVRSNSHEELQTDYTYPNDLTDLSTTDDLTKDVIKMQELNMVGPWIEKRLSKNRDSSGVITNTLLQSDFMTVYAGTSKPRAHYSINFSNDNGGSFIPVSSTGGTINIDEKYVKSLSEILGTDDHNNPNLVKNEGEVTTAYIWDYHNVYPIAKIINATQADIAYTSFEADGKGNWTYTGTPAFEVTAPTGRKAFTIVNSSNNIVKSGLSATSTYIVSYWKKSGTVTVNSATPVSGSTVDGWTYYEHKVVNPSGGTITVSGTNGVIDELRLYPDGAQMTTYTYEPLVGMTSQCDANNRITYYEYDGFGRLMIVRDQDKKVLKKICYNYAGQPEGCLMYGNQSRSQVFRKNDCTGCQIGEEVIYTVPADTYYATSQEEANTLALDDIDANGQDYANANGTSCTASVMTNINGYNGISGKRFTLLLHNNCTGTNYYIYLDPGASGVDLNPQIPTGNYNVTITPDGGSGPYSYSFASFYQYAGTASFLGIDITTTKRYLAIQP